MFLVLPGESACGRRFKLRSSQNFLLFLQKLFPCLVQVEKSRGRLAFSEHLRPPPVRSGLCVSLRQQRLSSREAPLRVRVQPHEALPAGPPLFQPAACFLRWATAALSCEGRTTGTAGAPSDPDHLDGGTRTARPLPVRGPLPSEEESAEGAPHLPFGEAPGVHADTAEDVLGRGEVPA